MCCWQRQLDVPERRLRLPRQSPQHGHRLAPIRVGAKNGDVIRVGQSDHIRLSGMLFEEAQQRGCEFGGQRYGRCRSELDHGEPTGDARSTRHLDGAHRGEVGAIHDPLPTRGSFASDKSRHVLNIAMELLHAEVAFLNTSLQSMH